MKILNTETRKTIEVYAYTDNNYDTDIIEYVLQIGDMIHDKRMKYNEENDVYEVNNKTYEEVLDYLNEVVRYPISDEWDWDCEIWIDGEMIERAEE